MTFNSTNLPSRFSFPCSWTAIEFVSPHWKIDLCGFLSLHRQSAAIGYESSLVEIFLRKEIKLAKYSCEVSALGNEFIVRCDEVECRSHFIRLRHIKSINIIVHKINISPLNKHVLTIQQGEGPEDWQSYQKCISLSGIFALFRGFYFTNFISHESRLAWFSWKKITSNAGSVRQWTVIEHFY